MEGVGITMLPYQECPEGLAGLVAMAAGSQCAAFITAYACFTVWSGTSHLRITWLFAILVILLEG